MTIFRELMCERLVVFHHLPIYHLICSNLIELGLDFCESALQDCLATLLVLEVVPHGHRRRHVLAANEGHLYLASTHCGWPTPSDHD